MPLELELERRRPDPDSDQSGVYFPDPLIAAGRPQMCRASLHYFLSSFTSLKHPPRWLSCQPPVSNHPFIQHSRFQLLAAHCWPPTQPTP